jgi:hypothetical protein
MKRPVSLVASLVFVLGTLAGCGAQASGGKDLLATICGEKGGTGLDCSCFADALATNLTPEKLADVTKAVDENRRGARFLPASLADDAEVANTISEARMTCSA